jgi:hypothetical protein
MICRFREVQAVYGYSLETKSSTAPGRNPYYSILYRPSQQNSQSSHLFTQTIVSMLSKRLQTLEILDFELQSFDLFAIQILTHPDSQWGVEILPVSGIQVQTFANN